MIYISLKICVVYKINVYFVCDIELSGKLHIGDNEHRDVVIYKGQSIQGSPEITLLKKMIYRENTFYQLMMYSMIICISISH